MRKAVGLALDGQSIFSVAQEFGIPRSTLHRYVVTAKKANGLPETAVTDRPTHAPSKKKKAASMKSDSGFVHVELSVHCLTTWRSVDTKTGLQLYFRMPKRSYPHISEPSVHPSCQVFR